MTAFPTEELHGAHHLIEIPPLEPRQVTSVAVSSGSVGTHLFDDESKFAEFLITTVDHDVDVPVVKITSSGLTVSYPVSLVTRYLPARKNREIDISFNDGGTATVEIREY